MVEQDAANMLKATDFKIKLRQEAAGNWEMLELPH